MELVEELFDELVKLSRKRKKVSLSLAPSIIS